MSRIHLVILWHMHQPLYRDPATGQYVMPWTRLHALKDYWGIVNMLEECPAVHATVNVVPSLALQLEEYASGEFSEPWFELATAPTDKLDENDQRDLLAQGFQVNRDTLLRRFPRYLELFQRVQDSGAAAAARQFGPRDWRDLQLLSQLAWFDELYLTTDPVVSNLVHKGSNYTEDDKAALRAKQLELLGRVLPEYRAAAARGQVELSTTPYYHPILPLVCDSDQGRLSNPRATPMQPPFRHPADAREQLRRARAAHERMFGSAPVGLWPSEGSVSDEALAIAAELGFRWFASDEGVLGRTLGINFIRDGAGLPENAARLYAPHRFRSAGREITGIFRDHYISDLVGFVYSRMDQGAAAEDLHRRIRMIGDRVPAGRPVTVGLILDGENAWEYYQNNGREFLRRFYQRIAADPDIRALSVSEALAAAGEIETHDRIFPGSWINANFDVWIGHPEDVQAWHLLREARDFYTAAEQKQARGEAGAPDPPQLAAAYESLLAAEGSDWCWWYGPEHSSAHDAEFDALYRKHLTEIYAALGAKAPDNLALPIKRQGERALVLRPSGAIAAKIDGRNTSYFEWLGAGLYSADRQSGSMHGRQFYLQDLYYGLDATHLYLRVDPIAEMLTELQDCEFVITLRAAGELKITVQVAAGKLAQCAVVAQGVGQAHPAGHVAAAFDKLLEVAIARELLAVRPAAVLGVSVAIWQGGLPVDLLPADGWAELQFETEGN
jgi:alpha-amylase/alpha-mannosidase (GH57 family)